MAEISSFGFTAISSGQSAGLDIITNPNGKGTNTTSSFINTADEKSDWGNFVVSNLGSPQSTVGNLFGSSTVIVEYLMRARDVDCVGVAYVYWKVSFRPDLTAAQYAGARCGVTPLTDITVVGKLTRE
jgi:hypothetical protein